MRTRLPLVLVALTILFALVASGCGDSTTGTGSAAPAGATPSFGDESADSSGSTGSGGAASESAQKTLEACIEAEEALADKERAASAKVRCQAYYDKIKESSAKVDEATSNAMAKCKETAENIPNADAKASALAGCAQIK